LPHPGHLETRQAVFGPDLVKRLSPLEVVAALSSRSLDFGANGFE